MAYSKEFESFGSGDMKQPFKIRRKRFELIRFVFNANKKADSCIAHHIDFDTMAYHMIEDDAYVLFSDK